MRRLRKCWRRWWRHEQASQVSAWTMHGLLAMAAFSLLVALCQAPMQRPAGPAASAAVPRELSAGAHELDPLIARTAGKVMPPGWDWRLLKGMVQKESGYDPRAESPGGAVGLTQMLPATARHMGLSSGRFFDAAANLQAGTRYLRDMYERFEGVPDRAPDFQRTRLAIASYNAGPGRVRRALEEAGSRRWSAVAPHLPSSTVAHVEKIVEEFYPSFAAIEPSPGRPPIGRWKPKLRFFRPSEL